MKGQKATLIISGIGPTFPLYEPLSEAFDVAVYDLNAAKHLSSQLDSEVMCPQLGAGQSLVAKARNDAALLIGDVVSGLEWLKMSGIESDTLQHPERWLPGLVAGQWSEVLFHLSVLDAFAQEREIAGVVVHEDVTPKFRALVLWAKARGIPTVHIPHGNCFLQVEPDIHAVSISDHILAAGTYMRDWYKARGYTGKIRITGFPLWDKWADIGATLDKEHARMVLHLEDRPTVMLGTGWVQRTNFIDDHELPEVCVHLALQAVRDAGWQLIWKMHPGDAPNREHEYAKLAAAYRVPALVTRDHLPYAIRAADVVLSVGPSNVLVEAGMCDRPPALFNFAGYGFDGEPPWSVATERAQIIETVEALMNGEAWSVARDDFITRYAHRNDGGAVARVVKAIKRIVR